MKHKAKMGRPRKPDAYRVMVSLKVSGRERRELGKAAKAAGLSLSAYIMAPHRKGR